MKRLSLISTAVVAALLAAPALANKATEPGSIYVGPRLGLFGTDSDRRVIENNQLQSFKGGFDTPFAGIEAGYQFTPEWGYRVYYDYLRSSLEFTGDTSNGSAYGVDVLYNFTPKVYGAVGINATEFSDIKTSFLRIGAGYRDFINDNWAFTVEGAVQQSEKDLTEFMVMTSLRYYFGGNTASTYTRQEQAPAPMPVAPVAPVVVDSDGDGVPDGQDKCPNTRAGYKVDADGCVMYENETVTRELVVTFALESAEVSADQREDVRKTAEFLKEYPQLNVVIEGHTDSTGSASYNQLLSERRAKAVGDLLINEYGIAASRVTTVGYGESRPKYPNDTRENREKNRRIEAVMSVTKQVPVKK